MVSKSKNFLITCGRTPVALDLARQLNALGHRVFIAETSRYHISRYSKSVEKSFVVPSPRFHFEEFVSKISQVIEENSIDILIPIMEETIYLAKAKDRLPKSCELFCSDYELLHRLHHKWYFYEIVLSLKIPEPPTVLIHDKEDLSLLSFKEPYALKACYSRASQRVFKITPTCTLPDIQYSPGKPWIAQKWLKGNAFCSYSICRDGKMLAHGCYQVHDTIDGSSCVSYRAIQHDKIEEWVKNFTSKLNFYGQISFDFIETTEGDLYAIECNPRATSGLHLFSKEDGIDQAFLGTAEQMIRPCSSRPKQLAAGMAVYGWREAIKKKRFKLYLKSLFGAKDVVCSKSDFKPFIMQTFLFLKYMWEGWFKYGVPVPAAFTYDMDMEGDDH